LKLTALRFLRLTQENYQLLDKDIDLDKDLSKQVGLLTVGTEDGHILFLNIMSLKQIVHKVSLHKTDIIGILSILSYFYSTKLLKE